MTDWCLYQTMLDINGETDVEQTISEMSDDFELMAVNSPAYRSDALRNGVRQRMLINSTQATYKYKIVSFPKDKLYTGDVITVDGENLIVTETLPLNRFQINGTALLCNLNLSFQNGTSEVITRPAVLDSGVYSTTKNGNDEVQYTDKQFKLYLPYDDYTKKIYVDKRIAVDIRYDKDGKEILEVYKVTGTNRVARSWGNGGHLLICELRSDMYSPENDSIEHMICDFIERDDVDHESVLCTCDISGRATIQIGQSRTYDSAFYDIDGKQIGEITPVWSVSSDIDLLTENCGNSLKITVSDNEDNIGHEITVSLNDDGGNYNTSNLIVEVVA